MNIMHSPDRISFTRKLHEEAFKALEVAIDGAPNADKVECLRPGCGDQHEHIKRKWMATITLLAVLAAETAIGSETVEDTLNKYDFCTC